MATKKKTKIVLSQSEEATKDIITYVRLTQDLKEFCSVTAEKLDVSMAEAIRRILSAAKNIGVEVTK